jgi:hypothetical protein
MLPGHTTAGGLRVPPGSGEIAWKGPKVGTASRGPGPSLDPERVDNPLGRFVSHDAV